LYLITEDFSHRKCQLPIVIAINFQCSQIQQKNRDNKSVHRLFRQSPLIPSQEYEVSSIVSGRDFIHYYYYFFSQMKTFDNDNSINHLFPQTTKIAIAQQNKCQSFTSVRAASRIIDDDNVKHKTSKNAKKK
jgi:hypothetical protein